MYINLQDFRQKVDKGCSLKIHSVKIWYMSRVVAANAEIM